MPTDRDEPWAGATYNGFSGPSPDAPPAAPPAGRQWPAFTRNRTLMGGVAAAVGLGLVLGVWAHPRLGADGKAREPMSASAVEAATLPRVPIEVTQPAPPPTVRTSGKMEVLPPDMVRAAQPPPRAPAAIESGADVAAFAPPEPLSRAERRALREAPIYEPAPDEEEPEDEGPGA